MLPRDFCFIAILGTCASFTHALTFTDWRTANFTPTQLSDETTSAATADPDSDGLVNLQEYVFFGRPLLNDGNLFPASELISGHLALTYAHGRQMQRSKRCVRKLRTHLGRVIREIDRQGAPESLRPLLDTSKRIHAQKRTDAEKVYSVHEPEVRASPRARRGANMSLVKRSV